MWGSLLIYIYIHTSRFYVRNYVRIVFHGGDHSKKVNFLLLNVAKKSPCFTIFPPFSPPFSQGFPMVSCGRNGDLQGQRPGAALPGASRLHDLCRATPLTSAVAFQRLLAAAHPRRAHAGAGAPEAGAVANQQSPCGYPIGSMYGIYGNIYHQYTPNVSIYTSTMDPMGYGYGSKLGTKKYLDG